MSAKSKKSSAKKTTARRTPQARISPAILDQGRAVAETYQVVLNCDEGHWYGRGLELPNVFGDGSTVEGCVADTREAIANAVAYLIHTGQRPPTPATTGRRTEQVNVRLTAEEKLLLEASAKRKGFEGLSDFIRAVSIEAAR